MQRHGRVAQWTRARGYEPRSRGFKSLLAHGHHLSSLARYAKMRNFLLYPSSLPAKGFFTKGEKPIRKRRAPLSCTEGEKSDRGEPIVDSSTIRLASQDPAPF